MTSAILRDLLCSAVALKIAVGCCAALCRFCRQPFPHGNAPALLCPFRKDPAWAPVTQEEHSSGRVEPRVGKLGMLQPPSTAKANLHLARFTLPRASQQTCIGEVGISHLCDAQETSQMAGMEKPPSSREAEEAGTAQRGGVAVLGVFSASRGTK